MGAQQEGCVTPRRPVRHAHARREHAEEAQPTGLVTPRHSAQQRQSTTRRVRHAQALRAAKAAHNRGLRHAQALSAANAAHNPKGASREGTQRGERSAQRKGCVTRRHSARRRQRTTRGVRHAQALRAANAAHNPEGASRPGSPRGKGSAQPEGCVTTRHLARRTQRTTQRVRHAKALSAANAAHNQKGASRVGTQRGEGSAQPEGCVPRRHCAQQRQRTTRMVRHALALCAAQAAHNPRGASRPGTQRGQGSAQPEGCVLPRPTARRTQRTTQRVRPA